MAESVNRIRNRLRSELDGFEPKRIHILLLNVSFWNYFFDHQVGRVKD